MIVLELDVYLKYLFKIDQQFYVDVLLFVTEQVLYILAFDLVIARCFNFR